MSLKYRLRLFSFFQSSVLGSYLTTLGAYLSQYLHLTGSLVGFVYFFIALSYLLTLIPAGVLADRFFSASIIYTILQLIGSCALFALSFSQAPLYIAFFVFMASLAYYPTTALFNSIILYNCNIHGYDRNKELPIVHIWGSIGFVFAVWLIAILDFSLDPKKYIISSFSAVIAGFIPFILHKVPIYKTSGHVHFSYIMRQLMACLCRRDVMVFFLLALPVGVLIQFSDLFTSTYLLEKNIPDFSIFNSISLISSILSGLVIIRFFKTHNFKTIILFSLGFWVVRNLCFAIGTDLFILLGLAVYGFAFHFFMIAATLYIYQIAGEKLRSFSQALFLTILYGIGGIFGSLTSGSLYDFYNLDEVQSWHQVWLIYTAIATFSLIYFAVFYRSHDKIKTRKELC